MCATRRSNGSSHTYASRNKTKRSPATANTHTSPQSKTQRVRSYLWPYGYLYGSLFNRRSDEITGAGVRTPHTYVLMNTQLLPIHLLRNWLPIIKGCGARGPIECNKLSAARCRILVLIHRRLIGCAAQRQLTGVPGTAAATKRAARAI